MNGVPDMGVPPIAGWFTREDSTKMDDKNGGSPILGHSHVFLGGDIKVIPNKIIRIERLYHSRVNFQQEKWTFFIRWPSMANKKAMG